MSATNPCVCCDAEADHRGSDGFFRCGAHRLTVDMAPFDAEFIDSLRNKIEGLLLAIRFGGSSAVHAQTLRLVGGGWALDAQRDIDGVRLKLARIVQAATDFRLHHALDGKLTSDVLDEAIESARAHLRTVC